MGGILLPYPTPVVAFPALARPGILLEEEWDAGLPAFLKNFINPLDAHRSVIGAGLATDDDPLNVPQVYRLNRGQERLILMKCTDALNDRK